MLDDERIIDISLIVMAVLAIICFCLASYTSAEDIQICVDNPDTNYSYETCEMLLTQ